MTLLDTSALLALILMEPGEGEVRAVVEAGEAWVAAVSWLELRIKLEPFAHGTEALALYRSAVAGTVDTTREIADAAYGLRKASPSRLPLVDSLIAASANTNGMRLLHRDAHFTGIPPRMLKQKMLPPK